MDAPRGTGLREQGELSGRIEHVPAGSVTTALDVRCRTTLHAPPPRTNRHTPPPVRPLIVPGVEHALPHNPFGNNRTRSAIAPWTTVPLGGVVMLGVGNRIVSQ